MSFSWTARCLAVFCCACGAAAGETIVAFSDPHRTNLTSSGEPMGTGFTFELGVFAAGFEPTSGNTSQWLEAWHLAAAGSYSGSTHRFAISHPVSENPAPFTAGAKAWVFGRRTAAPGAEEWILFRSGTWTWPTPNPLNPLPLEWNAADAEQVVVGAIAASGDPILMRSAAVRDNIPLVTWPEWRAAVLGGHPLSGAADDPDGDRVPNLLEFVFGGDPFTPGPPPAVLVEKENAAGPGHVRLAIPRQGDRLAKLAVETSADLAAWSPVEIEVLEDSPQQWVVSPVASPAPPPARRFYGVRATLPD